MSVKTTRFVVCDGGGCLKQIRINDDELIHNTRGRLNKIGWNCNDYTLSDFCPECYEKTKADK